MIPWSAILRHAPTILAAADALLARTRASSTGGHTKSSEARLGDLEEGARASGSRFVYLKGPLVRLEFALVQWVLELLEAKGFTPVVPPVYCRKATSSAEGLAGFSVAKAPCLSAALKPV